MWNKSSVQDTKTCNGALGRWLKAKRLHLPDITKWIQMWTLRDCDKARTGSNQIKSRHWEGKRTVSPLPHKLFVMDTCCRRETPVSLLGCYCACQPHFRTGSVPRSRWPTQNRFCFYMCASWLFIGFGFLVCFLLPIFIFYFLLFFFPVFVFVSEKERTWNWVDRAVGRSLEQLGERKEYNQNTLYEKN